MKKKGNGKFEIYLIASKIKTGDYDIDPGDPVTRDMIIDGKIPGKNGVPLPKANPFSD
ncbi:hypothetical protein [Fluviicola taffensis]|uniref:hypothetical protein n=1 Tax=Fluviicola taffensis TaxID=191579 RepID=UPI00313787E8